MNDRTATSTNPSLAAYVRNQAPTFLTLGLLGGLALWGSLNNWKLPWSSKESAGTDDPLATIQVTSEAIDSGNNGSATIAKRIEFPSAEAVTKAGIQVEPVQMKRMVRYVTANGAVDYDPGRYARLTARAGGSVWRVDKEIGDRVHKGDVLALVDATEVGQAKADLMQSLTQVDLRRQTKERMEAAYKRGAVPEQSLREAQAAWREAGIRLSSDHQRLLNLGLPVRLDELARVPPDQLAKYLRLLGLPEDIRRQVDTETLTANLLPLTAPFDGVVVQRNAAPGEVIEKNQPKIMFVLADIRRLHIDLDINPEDVGELRIGQLVRFTPSQVLPARPQQSLPARGGKDAKEEEGAETFIAKLSHISPEVDEKTRRIRVHAEVDNADGRLRPNDFGVGCIFIREVPRALVVPTEAIQSDGSGSLVFIRASDNCFVVRPVHLGLRDTHLVEVSGVRTGEQVATTGSFALMSELLKDRIAGGD